MDERTIALPFSIDAYGNVTSTSDQSKIWADRVRSVVGTTVRERVMRPGFGSIIATKVFDTQEVADKAVKANITEVFNGQLPLLTLKSVESTFDQYTNTLSVTITYALPNDKIVSTSIGLVSITGNNPPYEEKL